MVNQKILDKIALFINYRDRSIYETTQKLNSLDIPEDSQAEIIEYLISEGYINEKRFVVSFVRGKFFHKHWGRRKIRYGLLRHRIPAEYIEEVINQEIDPQDYHETILRLIKKKVGKVENFSKTDITQALYYLLSHGFDYEDVITYLK